MVQRLGGEAEVMPGAPDLADVARLRERLQRVSQELATAKEAEVREILRRLAGREVAGEYLGREGLMRLPKFREVGHYVSPDGQTEVDALASGAETWAVEVRWQVGDAGEADVLRLVEKGRAVGADRLWFISRGGFRSEALAKARQVGMLVSDAAALRALGDEAREVR